MQNLEFTVNGVALKVVKPNYKQKMESEKVKNTVFRQATKDGAYLMAELDNELKKRGFWDEDKDAQLKVLQEFIKDGVARLNEGGFDIDDAKKLAIEISRKRMELASLATVRGDFVDKTAEGQANNASFDYLVSQCAVYNDSGKPYFSSYEDYVARRSDDDAVQCATKLYELLYDRVSDEAIAGLPENQFLKEFGFVDEKLRYIDEHGRFIDEQGRLVNEDGDLINEEGKKIDTYGNVLDDSGKPIINRKPFTKNGKEIGKAVVEEVVIVEANSEAAEAIQSEVSEKTE